MNRTFHAASRPSGLLTRRQSLALAAATLLLPASGAPARAAAVPVDPTDADGVARAAREAIANGSGAVRLGPGHHERIDLRGLAAGGLEISGADGTTVGPTTVRDCSGLAFRGLAFRGEAGAGAAAPALVQVAPGSRDVGFEDCSFAATEDTAGWSARDWVGRPYMVGLSVRGTGVAVRRCRFFNLRNCLGLGGDGSVVEGCVFEDFGNDGIQFGANRLRISNNRIRGGHHTPADPLHADGMQGFPAPRGGVYGDVLIENNRVEFTGPGDYMQGISIFDGRWRDVRVVGNTVRVNAWNALALFGIDGVLVEGNHVSSTDPKIRNWIEVRASKSGVPSTGVVVRDNVAPVFRLGADARTANNEVRF